MTQETTLSFNAPSCPHCGHQYSTHHGPTTTTELIQCPECSLLYQVTLITTAYVTIGHYPARIPVAPNHQEH